VTVSAVFGILATAAINNAWDMQLWNQWDLLTAILEWYPSGTTRFAVFLCASFWAILVIGTNVAANMIPLGSDMALLFPRYMNMTRGQVVGLFLAWPICPWSIYASATVFTKFLSDYGLFIGELTGTMVIDYVLTKGNVFLGSLYDGSSANPHYYYLRGWNAQPYIAYICGAALGFPGFLGNLGLSIPTAARQLGYLGWLLSFTVAPLIYICLCAIWPT
jgi:NCS1 family nucleobase:cation symporter-1